MNMTNITYLGELENTIQPLDLEIRGMVNQTQWLNGTITGNVSVQSHVIGTDTVIGLLIPILIFLIALTCIEGARLLYDISDKRRRL